MKFPALGKKSAVSLFLSSLILFVTLALAGALPPIPSAAVNSITPKELKQHLSYIASDELGGRFTISKGNRATARYLASQLEKYGYRGAANGSFFQKIVFNATGADPEKTGLMLTANGQSRRFKVNADFGVNVITDNSFAGELVFVGFGIAATDKDGKPYDDYANLDVKGRFVVALGPSKEPPKELGKTSWRAVSYGPSLAQARGAAGFIRLPTEQTIKHWEFVIESPSANGTRYVMAKLDQSNPNEPPRAGNPFPVITAGADLTKAILAGTGKSLKDIIEASNKGVSVSLNLAGKSIKLTTGYRRWQEETQNVVGILEGSDPLLKNEYVGLGAHYDHLAISPTGQVYNGADDDGSGTVAVLEIAQAFTTSRPRRSILAIFHTGEEIGLLGSRYFADFEPLVPMDKIVAVFNIDMIGRAREPGNTAEEDRELTDADTVYLIGSDRLSTELHRISEETNAEMTRMKFDYLYNSPTDKNNFYGRSDHYNYAKHGIPIIFYFTGVHVDYHRPTDDIEKIDFEKMARIARTIFGTSWRVANLDHRVVVDKK